MLRPFVVALAALCALVVLEAPARAQRVIALAPLSALGTEDTSPATRKLTAQLEAAIAALPGTTIVRAAQVADAIKKSKKPQLRTCDGDATCLTELATLVGAQIILSGEVGGLGESRVVYLAAIASGKELRSTTLAVGGTRDDAGGPSGAIARLLDPDHYRGTLKLSIDVNGATIYVNGSVVTPSPTGELTLPVGTQAIRVTHPEYHDFVRFIDVDYATTTPVTVGMQQYPITRRDLTGKPLDRDKIEYVDPPLWRRWYIIAPAAVGVAILTAVITAYATHNFPNDNCHRIDGSSC